MGTNVDKQSEITGKTQLFRARPTPFVVRWRAFQHELALKAKATRLDFVTKISEFVAAPGQEQEKTNSSQFRKSLLSNSIA